MMATLSGQIDLTFFAFSSALSNARSGKLRGIAVGGQHRNPALPELPSISETVPGYLAASWTAIVAPPGTPPDVADRLRQAMIEIKEQPDVQARMVEAGDQVFNASPSEMTDFLMQERRLWSDLIRRAGIKAQ
jgi:tripartite-type tricarboxylate transporter receptor subunit TctC